MDTLAASPAIPRLSFTVDEATRATGASRTRIYQAIRNEKLTARKDGKSTLLLADELAAWLRSLPAIGKQPEADTA